MSRTLSTTNIRTAKIDPSSAFSNQFGRRARMTPGQVFRRYAAMPIALILVCVLLYFWIQWRGLDSIEQRTLNADTLSSALVGHLQLVAVSTVIVIVGAVPIGIILTRPFARSAVPVVLGVANIGQGLPSLGVLVVLAVLWGVGFWPAIVALSLYAFLPVLRNTMVGLRGVDQFIIEAARGQGMTQGQVLRRIEIPLAVPVMLAGIRTALIITVGTACVAVFTNAGGLGQILYDGIVQGRFTVLVAGAVLTGVVALTVDYLAGIAEEVLSPRGL